MAITLTASGAAATSTIPDATPDIPEFQMNPQATPAAGDPLEVYGIQPPDFRDDHEKAMDDWRLKSAMALDKAILDPKSYGDEQVPTGFTQDEWRKTRAVDDWMRLHLDGEDPPMGASREFTRARLATQHLNGQGAESDDALFSAITTQAQTRQAKTDLRKQLVESASTAEVVKGSGSPAMTFAQWRDEAAKKPGFDPEDAGDLMDAWYQTQTAVRGAIQEFKPQLDEVWQSMTKKETVTGAASLVNPISLFKGGATKTADQTQTPGVWAAVAAAAKAYDEIPDKEQRKRFLAALAWRAESLPKEEQAAFWDNLAKSGSRDIANQTRTIVDVSLENSPWQRAIDAEGEFAASDKKEFRDRRDFVADVENVRNNVYDRIKYLAPDGSWAQALEQGAYAAPGAIFSSATAAVPVIGMPLFFATAKEGAYQTYRRKFEDAGMTPEEASQKADALSVPGAALEALAERFAIKAFAGKLPFFEKAMANVTSKVNSFGARFAMRTAVGTVEEGMLEKGQDLIYPAVQEIAGALGMDVPKQQWLNGKDGVLDGFWKDSAGMLVTMLPLAVFGGAGGAIEDSTRVREWGKASDLQLQALGVHPDDVAAFRAAAETGVGAATVAMDQAVSNLDPKSESAKSAVEELMLQQERARKAMDALQSISYTLPSITALADGTFLVRDNLTGEEVGRASNSAELDTVIRSHSVAMEAMQEDEMKQLATWLGAARQAAKDSGISQELNLSRRFGMADVEAMGPAAMERFMAEVALQEKAEGGDGSAARAVFGMNVTEVRDGVKQVTNKIFAGANLGTIFHENWHEARRKAKEAGRLTRADDIRFLRALDTVLNKRQSREVKNADGTTLAPATRASFIPEGMADDQIPEHLLDEAVAEVAEVLTFLFPKGHKTNKHGLTRALVSGYMGTVGRLAPESTKKFSAFVRAIRAKMGLAMARAYHIKKGLASGKIDSAELDSYMAKMFGTDQQQEHDDGVRKELARVLAMPDNVEDDNIPFSVGRAPATDRPLFSAGNVSDLRHDKTAWLAQGGGQAGANEIVSKYYKTAAFAAIPKDAILVPMPSTSGRNILPDALAMRISKDFGQAVEKRPVGTATAKGEAKDKRTFFDKEADPVAYEPNADVLAELKGKPVFITEDVHNTGESWIAFARMLKDHGVDVRGVATLVSTEQRITSPRDIERLSEKVAALTGKGIDEVAAAMHTLFDGTFKQLFNKAEADVSRSSEKRNAENAAKLFDIASSGRRAGAYQNPLGNRNEGESGVLGGESLTQDTFAFSLGLMNGQDIQPASEPFPAADGAAFSVGLVSVHNLTSENLKFADEMGGLAVPSIAVVPAGNVIDGFGEITLVGGRPLADPAENPVYDADAYTARFPAPVWKAVPVKKAQELVNKLRPFTKRGLDRGWNLIDAVWDNTVNKPDPEAAISQIKRIPSAKAAFLSLVHGVEIQPIMKPAEVTVTGVDHPIFRKYLAENGAPDLAYDDIAGRKKLTDALMAAEKATLEERYKGLGKKDYQYLMDLHLQRSKDELDSDGLLPYGFTEHRLRRAIEALDTQELDQDATYQAIDDAMAGREAEFYDWTENLIRPLFAPPRLKVGGKLMPYTLENIVDVMTSGRVAGKEKTMTFSEGQVRAMNSHRFTGLEEMRNYAAGNIKSEPEVNAIREELGKRLAAWRSAVADFYKYDSTWDALDSSMEAMGRFLKGPRTPARMSASLQAKDFKGVPSSLVHEAVELGKLFMDAPVPYFESKPQRVVRLDEFSGAVIPESASKETRAILEKHGMEIETVPDNQSRDYDTRAAAVNKLLDKRDVRFSIGRAEVARHTELEAKHNAGTITAKEIEEAQKLVDEAAKKAGYDIGPVYHGSHIDNINDFKMGRAGAIYFTEDKDYASGHGPNEYRVFLKIDNLADLRHPNSKALQEVIKDFNDHGGWSANEAAMEERDNPNYDPSLDYTWEIFDEHGQRLVEMLKSKGYEGVLLEEREGIESYAVFSPSQIKSADPFTGVPLDKRFDIGSNDIRFSIGRAEVAERMQGGALNLVRDPVRRVQAMSRIARDFGDLALSFQRIEALAGRRRSKAQLKQEANAREDMAAEEKIGAVWAKYGALLADGDNTKLKAQPVHEYLSVPGVAGGVNPLRGRLMSKAQAMKKYPERYALHRSGEYDGSENVSRTNFGGTLMPDQAAQELFDHGLISTPTADAMWEALAREQNSVVKNKEALAKALEEIREAKREAKREANEWLQTQGKEQETNYNPKEEILASLRMLDAILLALPPEIRGKIGGHTQMAKITTDDARLSFLKDKLRKADKELETFLREAFNREWLDLLARAKPDKDNPGQRPTGVIDADALDILRAAEAAMWLSFSEGEAEADRLEALADHPDTSVEDADKLRATAQMVRLTANWSAGDAARREQAVIEGTRIYFGGLSALRIKNSARAARLRALQADAQAGTGKAGDRMERKQIQRKEKGSRMGQAAKLVWEFLSFGQLTNVLFGEKSDAAKWFNAREIAASNAYADGVQVKVDALEGMFENLSGSRFGGEKLRHRMQTEEAVKATDALGKQHTFTEAEAISFLLMWRQEDGRRHMEGATDEDGNLVSAWGWTDAAAAEIEKQLTPEGQAMLAFLGASYGEEYDRINEVFRRIWNVSMPRHKHYAPLTVKPVNGKMDAIVDPVSGDAMGVGMTPGSLKNRSQTAVAEPDFRDAFQTFITHARQMEHFIAYGEFARDAMAIVNRREIRNSIEAVSPTAATALGKWIDYFALGGLREAAAGGAWQQFFAGALSRLSSAALVGRVTVLGMQSLQLGAAIYKMPLGAYLSRFARLVSGQLEWGAAIKSDFIQRRMREMPPVVRDAVMGLASGRPNMAKYLAGKAAQTIAGADALFTAGTYAILYDYHLTQARKAGMADPEKFAHAEAERLTDQVAQPMRTGARSWLEISSQNNPAFRAMWNFSTDPRQKMALIVYEALRHDVKGKDKAAAVAKAAAVTWAVSGILQAVVRAVMRDLRSGDDDELFDERYWDMKKLALSAFTGPLNGIPYLGKMIEASVYLAAGEWNPNKEILDSLASSVPASKRLVTGDWDNVLKDLESVLTGAATFSGTAGAGASAMHLIRDAVNLYENFDGKD